VLAGSGLALLAAWVQNSYQIVSLPPDIYFISYLPIETRLVDFVAAGSAAVVICYLAQLSPAFAHYNIPLYALTDDW
jgi:lipoprotein-releasing system permease protein